MLQVKQCREFILLVVFFSCLNLFAKETEKKVLIIGSHKLRVEVVRSKEDQAKGLMFRKELSESEGMLFIFNKEQQLSFWMKNTFIPLSVGFFNKDQVLINIIDQMEPVSSEIEIPQKRYESKGLAQFALEVNAGWFKKRGIRSGQKFVFEKK